MNSTGPSAVRPWRWGALGLWVVWALQQPSLAGAQPASAVLEGARTGTPALLALVLKSDSLLLSADDLAEELSRELGVVVLPQAVLGARRSTGVITVSWRRSRAELAVSYDDPGRGVVSRVVRAPADAAGTRSLAVTLAGNLARDQVAELLEAPATAPGPSPRAGVTPPPAPALSAPVLVSGPIPTMRPILRTSPYRGPGSESPTPAREWSPITLSLFHPLATNGDQHEAGTWLHLNLLYGRVGELRGFELGGWNVVEGSARGVQLAMLVNHTGGDVQGMQATFGVNHAGAAVDGLQVGTVNVAQGPMSGVQVGLVNIAEQRVRGLQLGLINLADDMQGLPLGLVNVSRTGRVAAVLWASTASVANLGVKFINGDTYSILGAAMVIEHPPRFDGTGVQHFAGPGLTIGRRLLDAGAVTASSDLGVGFLSFAPGCCARLSDLWREYQVVPRWRVLLELERRGGLSPFVGGGIAVKVHRAFGNTDSTEAVPEAFAGLAL